MQAIVLLFQGLELLLEGLQAEHDTQRFMISAAISIRTNKCLVWEIDLHACVALNMLGVPGWEAGLGILGSCEYY